MLLESRPFEEIVFSSFCMSGAERNHSFSTLSRCRDLPFRGTLQYSAADPESSDRRLEHVPMITIGCTYRESDAAVSGEVLLLDPCPPRPRSMSS